MSDEILNSIEEGESIEKELNNLLGIYLERAVAHNNMDAVETLLETRADRTKAIFKCIINKDLSMLEIIVSDNSNHLDFALRTAANVDKLDSLIGINDDFDLRIAALKAEQGDWSIIEKKKEETHFLTNVYAMVEDLNNMELIEEFIKRYI